MRHLLSCKQAQKSILLTVTFSCYKMKMHPLFTFTIISVCALHAVKEIFLKIKRFPSADTSVTQADQDIVDGEEAGPSLLQPENGKSEFDVFLSFRGEDTRNGFTGHLYDALCRSGFSTFIDNEKLARGEKIDELFSYIQRSKVFVPIISKKYADSRWCLREIAKIVECERLIIPIFFDVEPSDVRNQTGPFKHAFKRYEGWDTASKEEARKWREALKIVSTISGFSLMKDANGHEATLVKVIVKRIQQKLNNVPLEVTDHQVGLDSRVDDMMQLLEMDSNATKMVGVVGIGGIGKTTIAKAVYNKLHSDFEGVSFISNIRERFKQPDGPVTLQMQLISDITKDHNTSISDIDCGRKLITERFGAKRVLVVLDDVDHVEQLEALAGKRDWFGSGTRIIVTTRNESLLLKHKLQKHEIYKPELLNVDQSFDLFSHYAFMGEKPQDKYFGLSNKFVAATGRLPLALKLFGSLLYNKTSLGFWEETLEKLNHIPNEEIQQRLQISYDALDETSKKTFLDISCFFAGEDKEDAIHTWKHCGWYPNIAISVLQERFLVHIDDEGKFQMHDLIRDMGRGIVRQNCNSVLWKSSRLWHYESILKLLETDKKEGVEGIKFHGKCIQPLRSNVFQKMFHLRLLHLHAVRFTGENFQLPPELKWLKLTSCKFQSLSRCNLQHIIVLDLSYADEMAELLVRETSGPRKIFNQLKILKISHCNINRTPQFSNMAGLVKLELVHCEKLIEVHESIGALKSLQWLDMSHCENLRELPDSICQLKSLETLLLSWCRMLSWSIERLGEMESLKELNLDWTATSNIPSSIGKLKNLQSLSLKHCTFLHGLPPSVANLVSLQLLEIEDNNFPPAENPWLVKILPDSPLKKVKSYTLTDDTIEELPDYLMQMEKLEQLSLKCKNLKSLPSWFKQLEKLKILILECKDLASIDEVTTLENIETLYLKCNNLEVLPASAGQLVENLKRLDIRCRKLKALPFWIGSLRKLVVLDIDESENIKELPASMGNLEILNELFISRCGITEVPQPLGSLPKLTRLQFNENPHLMLPSGLSNFTSLEIMLARRSKWSDHIYQGDNLSNLLSLKHLRLLDNDFFILPTCISSLPQLLILHIDGCNSLQWLLQLPSSLRVLQVADCINLKIIDVSNLKSLTTLSLGNCQLLEHVFGIKEICGNLEVLHLPGPCFVTSVGTHLGDALKNTLFKELTFERLQRFKMSRTINVNGLQQLSIVFPRGTNANLELSLNELWFKEVASPIHIAVLEDDRIVFETTREVNDTVLWLTTNAYYWLRGHRFREEDEIHGYLREGQRTIQVSLFDITGMNHFRVSFKYSLVEGP